MSSFKKFVYVILVIYLIITVAGCSFQKQLIFHPGKLTKDFQFDLRENEQEVFLKTKDGENINALLFPGNKNEIILYFHGNAGDLSSWQFIAQDFTTLGYNFFIIDYRGYGKSSGAITETGLYEDANTAYEYLVHQKGFSPDNIIIYGRSIGVGVAVELATTYKTKGLVLEAPYTSLKKLAQEKVPYLFPSLFLKFHFDNIGKINSVQSPILFFHGSKDKLIPMSHTNKLFEKFDGKKTKIIISGASHNDLNTFPEYHQSLLTALPNLLDRNDP